MYLSYRGPLRVLAYASLFVSNALANEIIKTAVCVVND